MSVPMRWEYPVSPLETVQTPLRRRTPRRGRSLRSVFLLVSLIGVGVLATVGVRSLITNFMPAPALRLAPAVSPVHQIALASTSIERRLGFVTVTGSAASCTDHNIPRVEAMVELVDGQDHILRVESAMLPLDPLPKGQSSPFHVVLFDDSRAVAYRVRFRQLEGLALN